VATPFEGASSSPDLLSEWPEIVAAAPARARSALSETLDRLNGARSHTAPRQRAEHVLEAIKPLLAARYIDAAVRLADLERLAAAASAVRDLAAWLAELTLDPPEGTGDFAGPPHLDEDYLVVSTVHSAKGLEWSAVHVPHMVDGCIPIDMALGTPEGLEEERRELYLYSPLRMPYHRHASDDRHGFATSSRFLSPSVAALFDVVEQPVQRFDVPVGQLAAKLAVDISSLWA